MKAMPAAAAAPVRNCGGSDQKFGSAMKIPQAVTAMTRIVRYGEFMYSATGTLRPATRVGSAMCQLLKPCFAMWRDHRNRAIAAGT